jgi:hypothetical protein
MQDYNPEYLRRFRNEIGWPELLAKLKWVHKTREGRLVFLCPRCREMLTGVNDRMNLGRCFRCKANWNPIDFTMEVWELEFKSAITVLESLLPASPHAR